MFNNSRILLGSSSFRLMRYENHVNNVSEDAGHETLLYIPCSVNPLSERFREDDT